MEKHELRGLESVAELMCVAARTAPKSKGWDLLETKIIKGKEKDDLVKEMKRLEQGYKERDIYP